MYLPEFRKDDPRYPLLEELNKAARDKNDALADAAMLKCLAEKIPYEIVRKVKAGNYGRPPPTHCWRSAKRTKS